MLRSTSGERNSKPVNDHSNRVIGTDLDNIEKKSMNGHATSKIKEENHVLVLYTGGTIGMTRDESGALVPKPNAFANNLREFPCMHDSNYAKEKYGTTAMSPLVLTVRSAHNYRIIYDVLEYVPLCDSSDMTMDDWIRIANDIQKFYNVYDGFVVLHGTDTLGYTASALSFMLEDLEKSVILTGSQVSIFDTRSDGMDNFVTSLIIAANYSIPEVCVFFGTNLMRGNRTSKLSASSFEAFHSPNFPLLATAGVNIEVDYRSIICPYSRGNFSAHLTLNRNVGLLRIFPGITVDLVKAFLQPPTEGVILQTYGAGNVPSNREDILAEFRAATSRGVIIVNTTQCITGSVTDSYKAGKLLAQAGVISGFDMTPEAALTKLAFVLSHNEWNIKQKRQMMQTNLRGELTSKESAFRQNLNVVDVVATSLKLSSRAEFQELTSILFPAMLDTAVLKSDVVKIKSLKESGADISQANADGRTALHLACCMGNLYIVQLLLAMGANVRAKDHFHRTPLIEAIDKDRHDIINVLLEHGAKLDEDLIVTNEMCNLAAEGKEIRLRSFLIANANVSLKDASGRTPLHLAALRNNVAVLKILLDHGARPECTDIIGHTPFDLARLAGAVEAMEYLASCS